MNRRRQPSKYRNQSINSEKQPLNVLIIVAIIGAAATIIAALIGIFVPIIRDNRHLSATQTADAIQNNLLQMQTPTVVPFGNEVFEVNFSSSGEGDCNDYDRKKLGYDTNSKTYYIVPNTGFVAVCHKDDDLQSAGILQVTAFPDKEVDYFGYGTLSGWKGTSTSTTAACGFGVRKHGLTTEAVFIQIIGGKWNHFVTEKQDINLDANPHSVRMVLYPSGTAIGYLDNHYVAEHTFIDCNSGPVGMFAYGPGDVKINFTSLKLFTLP